MDAFCASSLRLRSGTRAATTSALTMPCCPDRDGIDEALACRVLADAHNAAARRATCICESVCVHLFIVVFYTRLPAVWAQNAEHGKCRGGDLSRCYIDVYANTCISMRSESDSLMHKHTPAFSGNDTYLYRICKKVILLV